MLNQRLADMKKTLQHELKINTANSNMNNNMNKSNSVTNTIINDRNLTQNPAVMDDVNFKYLKHVILKFLTSREVNDNIP